MEVTLEEQENGAQILADAAIELPWVFRQPPRHNVMVTFSLWCGTEEYLLDDQPFPGTKGTVRPDRKKAVKEACLNLSCAHWVCLFCCSGHMVKREETSAKQKREPMIPSIASAAILTVQDSKIRSYFAENMNSG